MGRYFFSKDKWVNDMGDSCEGHTWPDDADNCEVMFDDEEDEWGSCRDDDGCEYTIHRDWCEIVDGIDLTGDQKRILRGVYLLGFKWLTKAPSGSMAIHTKEPYIMIDAWKSDGRYLLLGDCPALSSLTSYPDADPFDIAKALNVKN